VLRAVLLVLLAMLMAVSAMAQVAVVYSREDAQQAVKAYRLARVFMERVAIDFEIRPGARWRPEMAERICDSRVVLVVWSAHAAASAEVAREIATATACGVPMVPVLLDDTRLPADLAEIQAVEWRPEGCAAQ